MFKQVNKSQHTPTNQVELKENILFRMYSAGYMAKQKQTELVNTYQITNADYQNNCKKLKEKLYKGGIRDQEEIEKTVKFLVRHPSPDTLSLEMLAEYGKL